MSSSTFADAGKYNTQYSYDKNGNIKTLSRMGQLGGLNSYDFIDNLTYAYTGNQLKYVNDLDNHDGNHQDNGFTDNGSFLTTNEYFYDLNGNLTRDLNKQIDHIDYNHLNLPQHINIAAKAFNIIDYLYTANGVKLQKFGEKTATKIVILDCVTAMVGGQTSAVVSDSDNSKENKKSESNDASIFATDGEMSEMDAVCGEHIKYKSPEYWETLSDEQKNGYKADRVKRFKSIKWRELK